MRQLNKLIPLLLLFQYQTRNLYSDSIASRSIQISLVFPFFLIVVLVGILACGTSDTATPERLSKGPTSSTQSGAASQSGKSDYQTVPNPRSSEDWRAFDRRTNLTLGPKAALPSVLNQTPWLDQPPIGTRLGKTLPQFEITLLEGHKKSTTELSSIGRPVFLFFFTTW